MIIWQGELYVVSTVLIISSFSAFDNTLQFMLVFDVYMPITRFVRNWLYRKKTARMHTYTV